MNSLITWCKTYILEMLLAVLSVAVIAGYCYGFGFVSAPWARLLFTTGMVVLEMFVMLILNTMFKTPGDSAPFMLIYVAALLLLGFAICCLYMHYLANPWIMIIINVLVEVFLFLLSIVFVTIQRSKAIYNNLAKSA